MHGALPGRTPIGQDDAFLREFSPEGMELWTLQFGSALPDEALGVAVDGRGNIVVAGYTMGTLPGQTNAGDWDAFVVRLGQQSAS